MSSKRVGLFLLSHWQHFKSSVAPENYISPLQVWDVSEVPVKNILGWSHLSVRVHVAFGGVEFMDISANDFEAGEVVWIALTFFFLRKYEALHKFTILEGTREEQKKSCFILRIDIQCSVLYHPHVRLCLHPTAYSSTPNIASSQVPTQWMQPENIPSQSTKVYKSEHPRPESVRGNNSSKIRECVNYPQRSCSSRVI